MLILGLIPTYRQGVPVIATVVSEWAHVYEVLPVTVQTTGLKECEVNKAAMNILEVVLMTTNSDL